MPYNDFTLFGNGTCGERRGFMGGFLTNRRVRVIDSHTGGEPTRVIIDGGPDLGFGTMSERRIQLSARFDDFRSAVVCEPRGSDVVVGALLCQPVDPECVAGVLFFNNVGPLWMCGHGTIGLGVTLGHIGKIGAGTHRLETAVGTVTFDYDGANRVSLENVPSYRFAKDVVVDVDGLGPVVGDIAWGGNWFFLVDSSRIPASAPGNTSSVSDIDFRRPFGLADIERLSDIAWRIRQSLSSIGVTGIDGAEIDHVEIFGPAADHENHSRNFVLCPGRAYDRSPCGTGTSAKLACLFADGKLTPGETWRQESILGSVFEGSIRIEGDKIIPRIAGTAYITAETTLIFDPADPFQSGIQA